VLALGEIRTALLQHSVAAPGAAVARMLALRPGRRVTTSERPIGYAVSPDVRTGLDCQLPTRTNTRTRGVGTALTRASITGGRVLQASTRIELEQRRQDRRSDWSHYLGRLGHVEEMLGRAKAEDIRDGFLSPDIEPERMNLGAIGERILDEIQMHPDVDGGPPFRVERGSLRWALEAVEPGQERVRFELSAAPVRTLRLELVQPDVGAVVQLCEDIALHDWLLSTVLQLLQRAQLGRLAPEQVAQSFSPVLEHLPHLWLPGARVDEQLAPIWAALERRVGFSKQWEMSVRRLRDQISAATANMLAARAPALIRSERAAAG
jgi:hypothetical protein